MYQTRFLALEKVLNLKNLKCTEETYDLTVFFILAVVCGIFFLIILNPSL